MYCSVLHNCLRGYRTAVYSITVRFGFYYEVLGNDTVIQGTVSMLRIYTVLKCTVLLLGSSKHRNDAH